MQLSVPSCGTRKLKESGLPEGPLAHTRQVPGAFMGELRPPTLVNSTQQSKEKPRGDAHERPVGADRHSSESSDPTTLWLTLSRASTHPRWPHPFGFLGTVVDVASLTQHSSLSTA
jgi:hypothetical protein